METKWELLNLTSKSAFTAEVDFSTDHPIDGGKLYEEFQRICFYKKYHNKIQKVHPNFFRTLKGIKCVSKVLLDKLLLKNQQFAFLYLYYYYSVRDVIFQAKLKGLEV